MNKLILIVEDSRTQALMLENILQHGNYNVAIAVDGMKALEWLSNNTPLMVISDIMMPEMDGYELCKRIKSQSSTQDIPVILLTSLNGVEEVLQGLNSGADSFVTKPYDGAYLLAHIEKVLAQSAANHKEKKSFGAEIIINGEKRHIQTDEQHIIQLLLNIYEGSIQQNRRLLEAQENLKILNENLEYLVDERTSELGSQNALLSALINSPGDIIIFALDTQYCYTTFNENHRREMKRIWNADIQEGTNLLDCMSIPELKAAAKMSIDKALNGEFFTEIQHQPGAEIYYEFNWNPIIQNSDVVGITVFIKDISERKRTEQKIIDSENFIKTITSEVQEVIFAFDANGIFTFSEGKGLQKLGLSPGQVVGMSVFEVYKDYPEIVEAIIESLNGKMLKSLAVEIGSLKFDTTFQPIFDENGDVSTVVGLAIDVTEAKQAEEEIKLTNEELQKVNDEKDKFFSIIAHDLRSPLSAFLGFTEMMVEDLPNMELNDLHELAVSMQGSAESLYRLLENLLEWAKMKRGLVPYDPAVYSLQKIVNDSITMVHESAKKKEISINCDILDDPEVFVDSNIFQTILRNLISNAVKFTPKGGEIYISAQPTDSKNIEVSVKDSGIGMSPALLNNLFEINSKSNRKGTEGEPSSGLGLILCKEFVGKLGGRIWAESQEGEGSVFHFTISMSTNPEEISLDESGIVSAEEIQLGGLKILIAEDDEGSGMLLSMIVKFLGDNVIKVRTGVDAVQVCRENPDLDLILTDVRMPEMDGYEAVRQIRQFNTEVIIIAQTAYAQTGEREKALEAGCNDYISKPIQRDKLVALIHKYFRN